MKLIKKIILWVLIPLFIIFILANIAISVFAKQIVVQQIEQNLKLNSTLGSINIGLPFSINLNKLTIGDLFKADQVSVSPNILGFFAGKIVLSGVTLVNPVINLIESGDGSLNLPKLEQKGGKPPEIYLTALTVRNGKVNFTDKKIDPAGYRTSLAKINARISKVMLPPTSLKANFKVSSDILSAGSMKLGALEFSGWIDFGPKDMDAQFSLNDLDLVYFAPYYGNFISNKKLLSAKLNIDCGLKSKRNNLNIMTDFKLSNLVYDQEELAPGELPELNLAKNALDFFTDSKGNLNLEFEINTKLDNPNIKPSELKKIVLKAAAKNLANQSPEELIGKVNDNIEQFKAIGKALKGIFKGE
jgi:hypothetical protein